MQKSELTDPLEYRFLVVAPFHEENNFPTCVAIHRINLKDRSNLVYVHSPRIGWTEVKFNKTVCFVPHCTLGCQLAGGCLHAEVVQH